MRPSAQLGELLVGVVVAVHREAGAHEQLARLAGAAVGAVVLHDPDLDAAVRLAARSRLAQLVLGLEHRVDAELGRAVHLEEEAVAELVDDLLLQRVRHRRRVRDQADHRRQVGLRELRRRAARRCASAGSAPRTCS